MIKYRSHAGDRSSAAEGSDPYTIMIRFRRRDRLGYTRLKGEVESYQFELKRAAERVEDADGSAPDWLDEAESLLERAEEALDDDEIEEGWAYLHAARRVELDSLMTDHEDRNALCLQAVVALAEANALPDPWIRRVATVLLSKKVARCLKDSELTVTEVRLARGILDREYQQTHLRRRYVQEQFSGLAMLGVAAVVLFALLSLVGGVSLDESWGLPFAEGASEEPWFIVYVLLAGTIGAALFGIISAVRADPRVKTVPQTISSGWMVTARAVTGAISAFVLYLFVQAGILGLGGNSEAAIILSLGDNPEAAILLIAVVAGYSERLAPKALEAMSEQVTGRFDRDEGRVRQLEELLETEGERLPRPDQPETEDAEGGPAAEMPTASEEDGDDRATETPSDSDRADEAEEEGSAEPDASKPG